MAKSPQSKQQITYPAMWDGFWDFISQPYANNSRQLGVLRKWHDNLKERNDINLERAQIADKKSGLVLDTYVVNRQIIFSHDMAVLTVPYPRSTQDNPHNVHNDQLVGAWLHDFGEDINFFNLIDVRTKETSAIPIDHKEIPVSDLEPGLKPYIEKVYNGIKGMEAPSLPGGAANTIQNGTFRLHGADPRGWGTHRDNRINRASDNFPPSWTRQFFIALKGRGTVYGLDGNQVFGEAETIPVSIEMPGGVPAVHLAFGRGANNASAIEGFSDWGIRHYGPPDPGGRATLLKEAKFFLWEPVRDVPSPWHIEYQSSTPELVSGVQAQRPPSGGAGRPAAYVR